MLTGEEVRNLLRRMSVPCEPDKKDKNLLKLEVPMTFAGAAEQPVNRLSDLVRVEMANAGFTEALNWALLSRKENFGKLRREEKPEELWRTVARPHEYCESLLPVSVKDPKTKEFEILRTSLLPCILKTLERNKGQELPIKIFET